MIKKTKVISFAISFLWISLGTLMQLSAYPSYNFLHFDYNSICFNCLYYITFPFNIPMFALILTERLESVYVLVILLQITNVLICWWIVNSILKKIITRYK